MMASLRTWLPRGIAAVAIIVGILMPFLVTDYDLFSMSRVLAVALGVVSLNLLMGSSGQISLGHGAIFGIGGYAAMMLMRYLAWPVGLAVLGAVVLCIVLGIILGFPGVRLGGFNLGLLTIVIAALFPILLYRFSDFTGGQAGITLSGAGLVSPTDALTDAQWAYLVILLVLLACVGMLRGIVSGRTGRALAAVRASPILAASMGVNADRLKLVVFVISSALAALAAPSTRSCSDSSCRSRIRSSSRSHCSSHPSLAAADHGGARSSAPLSSSTSRPGSAKRSRGHLGVSRAVDLRDRARRVHHRRPGRHRRPAFASVPRGLAGSSRRTTSFRSRPTRPTGDSMTKSIRRSALTTVALLGVTALALSACTPRGGEAGQTPEDGEKAPIVIGVSWPLSGPAGSVAPGLAGIETYIAETNDDGGIDGHPIELVTADDAYDPARLVENQRKFVEKDGAVLVVNFGGISIAGRDYLKQKDVAGVSLAGNSPLSDIENYPLQRAFWPDVAWEGELQAQWIKEQNPDAVVGYVGFNNDLSESQLAGLATGGVVPAEQALVAPGTSDLSAQVSQFQASGVDTLVVNIGAPTVGALLGYIHQIGWKPTLMLGSTTSTSLLPSTRRHPRQSKGRTPSSGTWTRPTRSSRRTSAISHMPRR